MDSRIIDVAIGLVLVFALTSLLVATLVEGVSTLLKQRGRVLTQAIVSFVGDDQSFAKSLLRHPLLVSLAPGNKEDDNRKPSYIGADVMIASLLSRLTQQYAGGFRPASPAELIAAVQAGGLPEAPATGTPVNDDFRRGLASLVLGVENDWPAYETRLQAWFDSVTARAGGWYKRWTQMWLLSLGFAVAVAANINPLVIGPRLWNDAALRQAMVSAGQEASKKYGQSTSGADAATHGGAADTTGAAVATETAAPQPPALVSQTPPQRLPESTAVARDYARLEQALIAAAEAARQRPADTGAQTRIKLLQELNTLPDKFGQMRMPDDDTMARVDIARRRTLSSTVF